MNANLNVDGVALWLADFHLLAMALLVGVLAALLLMKQPARRMAVVKATLGALAALALLCALPGWSVVHLMTDRGQQATVLTVDSSLSVRAERSATQLIPTINVDRIPRDMPEPRMTVVRPQAAGPWRAEVAWWKAAASAHAVGSAGVVLWLIDGAVMARRIRRGASAAPIEIQRLLQRVVGGESVAELLVSAEIATPVALGVRRPAIILPATVDLPAPSPSWGGLGRGARLVHASAPLPTRGRGILSQSSRMSGRICRMAIFAPSQRVGCCSCCCGRSHYIGCCGASYGWIRKRWPTRRPRRWRGGWSMRIGCWGGRGVYPGRRGRGRPGSLGRWGCGRGRRS